MRRRCLSTSPVLFKKTFSFQGEVEFIMLMWKRSSFFTNISLERLWRTISNACCCCGCWIRKKRLWIPLKQPQRLHLQYYIKPPSHSQREKARWVRIKIPPLLHHPPSFIFPLWNFSFSFTKLFPLLLDFPIWLWLVFHCFTHPYFPPIFLPLPLLLSSSPAARNFSG